MSAEEKKQLADLNDKLKRNIDIRLIISEDTRSQNLKTFCMELAETAPKIRMILEKDDAPDAIPGLHISPSLIYHTIPQGTELLPFLDTLVAVSDQDRENLPSGSVQGVEIPARLTLYVSSMCTFCPAMVRKLVPLAMQDNSIRLTIVDAMLFPEMAETDHVRSVPTLILDDQFRWTGSVDLDELLNTIQHRDPAELSAGTLASMITDGKAYELAEMMLKQGCLFPGFIDLLTHQAFSTRLGAMAVAEEIAERRMSLAVQMTTPLVERFEPQIDAVKGDILYVLGMSGDRGILGFLKKIASGEYHQDIKEAAAEAMDEIQSR
jgi:glutaredoxin